MKFKRLRIELDTDDLLNVAYLENHGYESAYYINPGYTIESILMSFLQHRSYLVHCYHAS